MRARERETERDRQTETQRETKTDEMIISPCLCKRSGVLQDGGAFNNLLLLLLLLLFLRSVSRPRVAGTRLGHRGE